ncbi:MAG: hypothetical protein AAF125_20540, partial [Chloroflexota bacterium]
VTVTEGYLVSAQARLLACEHAHSMWDWWVDVVSAGHGEDEGAETLANAAVVEHLHTLEATTLASVPVATPEPAYCTGHYVAARALDTTVNLPESPDLFGTTLYIQGTYTRNGEPPTAFTLRTNLNYGQLVDLSRPARTGDEPVTVEIVRPVATIFDGVDFATASPELAAKDVLWALAGDVQIRLAD